MSSIKLFENKQVRSKWDDELQTWFFSIVDIGSSIPRTHWSVLATRLKKEGSELATNCSQLKMKSADGKQYSPTQRIGQGLALTMPWHIAQNNIRNQALSPANQAS